MVDPVLVHAAPSPRSYSAQPLSVQEIDNLPEPLKSRVWATVHMLQLYAQQEREAGDSEGFQRGINA